MLVVSWWVACAPEAEVPVAAPAPVLRVVAPAPPPTAPLEPSSGNGTWRIEGPGALSILAMGGSPPPRRVERIGAHTTGDPPTFEDPFDRPGDRLVVADADGHAGWVGLDRGEGRWEIRAVGGHPAPPLSIVPEAWLGALGAPGAPDDPWLVVPAELTLASGPITGTLRIRRSGWATLEGLPDLPAAWGWADPSSPTLWLTLSGSAFDVVLEMAPDPWSVRFVPVSSYDSPVHLRRALADPCGGRDEVALLVTDAGGATRGRIVYTDGLPAWEDPTGARFDRRGGQGTDSRIELGFADGTSFSVARATPKATGIPFQFPDLGAELLRSITGESPCRLGKGTELTTCTARRVRHDPGSRACAPSRQPSVAARLDPATAAAVAGTVVAHGPDTNPRFPWPRNPAFANRTQGQEGDIAFVPDDGGAPVVLPVRAVRGMSVTGNGAPAILVSDAAGPAWLALAKPEGRYAVHPLGARPPPAVPWGTRESLLSLRDLPPVDGVVRLGQEDLALRLELGVAGPRATLDLGSTSGGITLEVGEVGADGGLVLDLRGPGGAVQLVGRVGADQARFHAEPGWFADRAALTRWLVDGCGAEPQLTFALGGATAGPERELRYRERQWTVTVGGRSEQASRLGTSSGGDTSRLDLGFSELGSLELALPSGWAERADWAGPPPRGIERFDVLEASGRTELDRGHALWLLARERPISGVFADEVVQLTPEEWLDVADCRAP